LVCFDNITVESIYQNGSAFHKRTFEFSPDGDGIKSHTDITWTATETKTIIKLDGFKKRYSEKCHYRSSTLASHIIAYCLEFFRRNDCPELILHDDGETLNINGLFKTEFIVASDTETIPVANENFSVNHVFLKNTHVKEHKVCYCANQRVVTENKLTDKQIPDLEGLLTLGDKQDLVYAAYVDSKFFDENVNQERTSFTLPEEPDLLSEDLSWKKIQEQIEASIVKKLSPLLQSVNEEKIAKIKSYIQSDAPEYVPMVNYLDIGSINRSVVKSPDALNVELYKRKQKMQVEIKEIGQKLLSPVPSGMESDYDSKLHEYLKKVEDINKSELTRYICSRKTILDLFEGLLRHQSNGKFPAERAIHDLIFAMGQDSGSISREHNLWIIDEKLAFQNYIASDKKISKMAPLVNDGKTEPDLAIFHAAFDVTHAYSEDSAAPFNAITLIEFKKPEKTDYDERENPLVQLMGYIDQIKKGKATKNDGAVIRIPPDMPFYCYAICNLTDKIKEIAEQHSFIQTTDGLGYFGFIRKYGYFEIIDYAKFLADAKKRHRIFFEKLGLPTK